MHPNIFMYLTAMSAVSIHNLVTNFNDVTQQSIDLRTSDTNWTYDDNLGQMFAQCNGSRQSPINIDTSKVTENLHLRLGLTAYDKPIAGFLLNQFPTFQLAPFSYQWPRPNALISSSIARAFNPMADSHFVLNYVQFYWSQGDPGRDGGGGKLSVHKMNGENFPAELHFVHLNTAYSSIEEALTRPDGLLIFAVMVVPSTHESYIFDKILDELQSQNLTQPNQRLAIDEDSTWRSLLPADTSRFYRYHGSMIAPPCHESVQWIVFEDKLKLGHKQLKRLRRYRFLSHDIKRRRQNSFMDVAGFSDKVDWTSQRRPMQPLNGRLIECSFSRQVQPIAAATGISSSSSSSRARIAN